MDTNEYQIDREDFLLLLLDAAERQLGSREIRGVTRLEKLLFLLANDAGVSEVNDQYHFEAYKFGPFSADVYDASEFLVGIDLLSVSERPVYSYYATSEEEYLTEMSSEDDEENIGTSSVRERIFSLTDSGRRAAEKLREIWASAYPEKLSGIDTTMKRFGKLPLNQLIRYVYRKYPDSARNSIHPEAAKIAAG